MLQRGEISVIHLSFREFAKARINPIGRRAALHNRVQGVVALANLVPGVFRERHLGWLLPNLPELIQCHLTRNQINGLHDSGFPC